MYGYMLERDRENSGEEEGIRWGGWGAGGDDNPTYLDREKQNTPLDWIMSTTCAFPDVT